MEGAKAHGTLSQYLGCRALCDGCWSSGLRASLPHPRTQLPHPTRPGALGLAQGLPAVSGCPLLTLPAIGVAGQKRRKGGQGRRENANRNPSRKEGKEAGAGARRRKGQQQQHQGTVGPITSAGPT